MGQGRSNPHPCLGRKTPELSAWALVTLSLTGQLFFLSFLPAQRLMGEVSALTTQSGELSGTFGSSTGTAHHTHN